MAGFVLLLFSRDFHGYFRVKFGLAPESFSEPFFAKLKLATTLHISWKFGDCSKRKRLSTDKNYERPAPFG
jgi:hypothetical protein